MWQKKWADKAGSNFREGSSSELGICSRPVWDSAYGGNLPRKTPWKCGGFCGGFLRWIFLVAKSKRKIRRKICQPKTKNPPAHDPPKSASQAQKSAAKPTNKSVCQTSKYTPGFLRLRRIALGGVFRAWILGRSLAAFWAWSRLTC